MTRLKSLRLDRPLSKREKALAGIFLLLLAASLYYFLVLEKQLQRIKYLQGQIAQRETIVRDMYQKNYHNISDMENKIQEYDAMIARAYEVVPNIKDTPGLLVDFYRLLEANRLISESISFGQLKHQQNYSTFTMGLKVKGLVHDVQNFLKSIEKYKRAVTISKLDFNPTQGGLLETSLDLTVYVLDDISPDPLDYPFMEGQFGAKSPFDLFKYPETEDKKGIKDSEETGRIVSTEQVPDAISRNQPTELGYPTGETQTVEVNPAIPRLGGNHQAAHPKGR